jgi:hypothetical protein
MTGGQGRRRGIVEFFPEVTAHATSFEVSYGVITPTHTQFRHDQGFPAQPWPPVTTALLYGRLLNPGISTVGVPGRVLPSSWILGDEQQNAAVGTVLVRALKGELLPRIDSWFDPDVMARTLEDRPPAVFPGLGPNERAVAMALLDVEGAGDRLRQTLDRLPPDDMVRHWIERRLAGMPSDR